MEKITEEILEQYLRFPDELSEQEKKEIEAGLKDSEELRLVYTWLKDFYEEFDKISHETPSVVPLKAVRYDAYENGPVVLAAMTQAPDKSTLITKATLVSEEHHTLVRVLENTLDKSLQFYVLSKEPAGKERAILSIVKPEMDLVTDANGRLKNVKELSDIQWDTAATLLRIPVEKTSFIPSHLGKARMTKEVRGEEVELRHEGSSVAVTFTGSQTKITRVLLVQHQSTVLKSVENGRVRFEVHPEQKVQLFFYE